MGKKFVVCAIATVALTAGCTGGGNEREPQRETSTTGVADLLLDPERQPPAPDLAGATAGGTVRVVGPTDPVGSPSLDPSAVTSGELPSILTGLVTRTLTQFVYDGHRGGMVLIPDLATDLGTPNADYTEWTFTIRKGVRFENGQPVTAEDVAYGIKRSFDLKTFPYGAGYINSEYFLGGDTYQGPYRSGTDYDGVVVDGDRVTLRLAQPWPEMPYYGAFQTMGPVPEDGSTPGPYGRHPLATGPYEVSDFEPGTSLTLVRNDQWDPDTDPGRHAYPDRYMFTFGEVSRRSEESLVTDAGASQTTLSYQTISADNYREAQRSNALARVVVGLSGCPTAFAVPDYRKMPDLRVRQAIGHAFPYREYWRARGEILGVTEVPGESLLPPGLPGRVDDPVLSSDPWQTDPDKAQALLKQAGFEPGQYRLTFPYIDPDGVELRDVLVAAFEEAGFRVTPFRAASGQAAYAAWTDPRSPVNIHTDGWCPAWPSGTSWLPPLFGGDGANTFRFHERAVDEEMDRIPTLPLAEQPAAWGALDHSIQVNYYPAIITGYNRVALLHGSRIGGMNIDTVFGMPTWEDIYVTS